MLGLVTGLIGPRAIHATTEAIERVVLRHLEEQLVVLDPLDAQAAGAIRAIIADEQLHHDTAFDQLGGQRGMLDRTIDRVVSASTELVIWLGMKL